MDEFANSADEIKQLRRCVNDLVRIIALPAIWGGGTISQIVSTLTDVLVDMLHLDLVYVRLENPPDDVPFEMVRFAQSQSPMANPQEIGKQLHQCLGQDPRNWPSSVRGCIGNKEVSIAPYRLGLQGEIGLIVAGVQRSDFPRQTESLLLSGAANQVVIGLHEARLLSELDERVEQRTTELAEANEELRKEITERKLVVERLCQEEKELKRSEAHKAAILDSALDCVIAIDHESRITEFNPAAERTLGYRRGDVVGKFLADIIVPPSLREKHRMGFARYLATGEARVLGRRIEMTALCADAREIPVELAITRIPQDGPPAFTGYLRDITEYKRNEDALHTALTQVARSEERWRSVFENSAVGVVLTDLNGGFIATNPVFQRMLGYTEEELQNLTFRDIANEKHLEADLTLVRELLDGKRRQFQIEKQYRRKDGKLVWVQNNVSLVPGSEQVPRFLMALFEDITERKQAEEALAKARSELAHITRVITMSELASSIAHEINQPLGAIVNYGNASLRLLSGGSENIEEVKTALAKIVEDANRASAIIAQVRALSKKAPPEKVALNVKQLIDEVMALTRHELYAHLITFHVQYAENLPPILGDRVQIQQLLLNLVMNGIEATSAVAAKDRTLAVNAGWHEADGQRGVLVRIQDAGVGLRQGDTSRLFEAFYTTKPNGLGMGLAICRSIVEVHGGKLWAEPNDGPGATFCFVLPAALPNKP